MRLLLASSFELIDLKSNAEDIISNVNIKNLLLKFLKIRISLSDETKNKKELKILEELLNNYQKTGS